MFFLKRSKYTRKIRSAMVMGKSEKRNGIILHCYHQNNTEQSKLYVANFRHAPNLAEQVIR